MDPADAPDLLWYDAPAAGDWNRALPLGSGRLGAMVFGEPRRERIQLTEDSLWSGGPRDRINPDAREALAEARRLILAGDPVAAERGALDGLSGCPDIQRHREPLADLLIEFDHGEAADYRRELDLDAAQARVAYAADGARIERVALCSAADGVFALRIAADRRGAVALRARLERGPRDNYAARFADEVVPAERRALTMTGAAAGALGVGFAVHARIAARGGTTRTIGETIVVSGADEALLVLAAATTFRERDPAAAARAAATAAIGRGWEALRERHLAEYAPRWRRATFSLPDERGAGALPTDRRLARVRDGHDDPALIAQYARYGRYLLIASSRPGSLPATLQGVWNQDFHPAWGDKWTVNVNAQMNYWPAETWNLADCHGPLLELVERVAESGRATAQRMYGCGGFACHHNTDLWADTCPVDRNVAASFWPLGGAWLALHWWERWRFGSDRADLRRAHAVLRGAARFVLDVLVADGAGRMVCCPTSSPENAYLLPDGRAATLCAGTAMDTAIIDRLLRAVAATAAELGVDAALAREADAMRARLPPLAVGADGRLREWLDDVPEAEPGHRHVSHLWALHPGDQIDPRASPELARAARASLEHRLRHGGGHTGWSRAWIACFCARLGDGAAAGEHLRLLLAKSTLPNLLDDHPPFQIDGNLGGAAAVAEMLVQSHRDEIVLLPALPPSWRAGAARGLRARGGFELDLAWRDGRLQRAQLRADAAAACRVRLGERAVDVELRAGERRDLAAALAPRTAAAG